MNELGITEQAILFDNRRISTNYEAPEYVVEALAQVFPMVELDWHPVLQRWTLWERNGRIVTLIAAIAGPLGEYQHPNLHNTIGLLDRCLVRGRINSKGDFDEWLAEVDKEPAYLGDMERRGEDRIAEGSKRFWDLLHGKTQVQVDKR